MGSREEEEEDDSASVAHSSVGFSSCVGHACIHASCARVSALSSMNGWMNGRMEERMKLIMY